MKQGDNTNWKELLEDLDNDIKRLFARHQEHFSKEIILDRISNR